MILVSSNYHPIEPLVLSFLKQNVKIGIIRMNSKNNKNAIICVTLSCEFF